MDARGAYKDVSVVDGNRSEEKTEIERTGASRLPSASLRLSASL